MHLCTVTGMPVAQIVHPMNSTGRYGWYGRATYYHQGVEHSIHSSVWHSVASQEVPAVCGTMEVINRTWKHTIQGVYAPYTGKGTTGELEASMGAALAKPQATSGPRCAWNRMGKGGQEHEGHRTRPWGASQTREHTMISCQGGCYRPLKQVTYQRCAHPSRM